MAEELSLSGANFTDAGLAAVQLQESLRRVFQPGIVPVG